MRKIIANSALILLSVTLLTSCYSTSYTYRGNVHQQAVGKSKNEILRTYGVPDQTTDDGAGGSVLVYQRVTQTTVTNASSATYGRSATVGAAVYGNNGVIAGSQSAGGSISAMNGISQTSSSKTFCYLFLDKNNIVYDFKTNYGAQYDVNRCFDKSKTWIGVGASCLLVYPAIVTIPWAIIAQGKAKKSDMICK